MRLARFFLIFFTILYSFLLFILSFQEETIRLFIRITADFSVFLFLLSFSASAINMILKNRISKFLLSYRNQFGISFAISHLFHLLFIATYASMNPTVFFENRSFIVFLLGGTTYLFIIAMLFTSFTRFRKMLSNKSWKRLHTIGSYLILLVFLNSFMGRVTESAFYFSTTVVILIVLFLRVFYTIKRYKK